jgi:hypothetical protein
MFLIRQLYRCFLDFFYTYGYVSAAYEYVIMDLRPMVLTWNSVEFGKIDPKFL